MRGKVNRAIGQNLRRERFLVYQACKAHVWTRVRALNRSVHSPQAEQVLLTHCEKLRKKRLADPNTPLPLVTEPLDADERATILASYAPGEETPPPRNEKALPEDWEPYELEEELSADTSSGAAQGPREDVNVVDLTSTPPKHRHTARGKSAAAGSATVSEREPKTNTPQDLLKALSSVDSPAAVAAVTTVAKQLHYRENRTPRRCMFNPSPTINVPDGLLRGYTDLKQCASPEQRAQAETRTAQYHLHPVLETVYCPFELFDLRNNAPLHGRRLCIRGELQRNGPLTPLDEQYDIVYEFAVVEDDPLTAGFFARAEGLLLESVKAVRSLKILPSLSLPKQLAVDMNPYYIHQSLVPLEPLGYPKKTPLHQLPAIGNTTPALLAASEMTALAAFPRELIRMITHARQALSSPLAAGMDNDVKHKLEHITLDMLQTTTFYVVFTERLRQRSAVSPHCARTAFEAMCAVPLHKAKHLTDIGKAKL